jgi:hypothetical protein
VRFNLVKIRKEIQRLGTLKSHFSPTRYGAVIFQPLAEQIWLAILTAVLASMVCFIPRPLVETTDYVAFYHPHFHFLTESVADGRLPLWNPYIGLGRPFLADSQTAVFYPPVYLMLFGEKSGLFLLVWFHMWLAATGMRALSQALQIGKKQSYFVIVCFLCSGILMGRWFIGHLLYAGSLCYIPWLFANAAQDHKWQIRPIAFQALLMALQLLSGHPQPFWFSTLALGVFVIARNLCLPLRQCFADVVRSVSQLAMAGLGSLCLSAVMLLPFLELIQQGNRAQPSAAFADFGSMEWKLFQAFYQKRLDGLAVGWESNVFVGVLVVVLGLAGLCRVREKNVRGLIGVAVFSLLVSLGERSPLFNVFLKWLPGYGILRIHARAAMLVSFALICGAGIWLSRPHNYLRELWSTTFSVAPRYVFWALMLIETGLLLDAAWLSKRTYWAYDTAVAADSPLQMMIATKLGNAGLRQPAQPPPRISVPPTISLALQNTPNNAMICHYSSFDAYTSLFLRRPWIYLHSILGLEPAIIDNTYLTDQIYKRGPLPYKDMNLVAGFDGATKTGELLLATNPSPRAFVVYAARVVPDYQVAVTLLTLGHDIRRSAVLEELPPLSLPETNTASSTTVQFEHFDPNKIVVNVDAEQDGLLVLAEGWYPGWKAKVDERDAVVLPANAWMRAIPISRGQHRVQVYFHQNYLLAGTVVSSVSLAVLGFAFWPRRKELLP